MTTLDIRTDDLLKNPTPRLPIGFCLDGSGSMHGDPIDELNRGIARFYSAVQEDPVARNAAEAAVVLFAERSSVEQDFGPILHTTAPMIEIPEDCGGTALGAGVTLTLDRLDERKREYQRNGVEYYQPWLVIITDGHPTDRPYPDLVSRIAGLTSQRKLSVFAIGVGEHASLTALTELSPLRRPIRLRDLNFQGFFEFLSRSVSDLSASQPEDESVGLNTSGMEQWAVV